MTSAICAAIQARVRLAFDYGGYPRIVEPYCHGRSKSGEVLRAVQVGGGSRSGGFGFGKLWIVAQMSNLRATEDPFTPSDPDYNPDDSAMGVIHCRV